MASNYYPMVSSSPPPLDDGPSFDDDDGDFEFGHFSSAEMGADQTLNVQMNETIAVHVSKVDVDSTATNEGLSHGTEILEESDSSERQECDSNAVAVSDSISARINIGDCDSLKLGEELFIEKSDTANSPVPEEPPLSVICHDGSPDIPVEPLSDLSLENVEGGRTTFDENEIFVDPEQVVSETLHFNGAANEISALNNTDSDAEQAVLVENLRSEESSCNVESSESMCKEHTCCNSQDDDLVSSLKDMVSEAAECLDEDVVSSLKGTESEVAKTSVLMDCPEDVGDWNHSDSSFDDFTDFQTAPASEFHNAECAINEPVECIKSDFNDSDAFDDFAAFDETEDVAFECDFGTTSSSSFHVEEEFGNFNSASSNQFTEVDDVNSKSPISALLTSAFPESIAIDQSTVIVKHLDEALRCASICGDPKTLKSLWSQLHDIDNTHALTYHWSQSQSNKKLLHSLRIDARNFLAGTKWNSSMPLFAATLGSDPLEPRKATLPYNDEENTKSLLSCDISTLKFGGPHETAVPPAQFDWGSSGLVNPLDDSTSCTLLDLDFFLTNDIYSTTASSLHINSLESEFLGSTSSSQGKLPIINGANAGSSLLVDKILSQAAKSTSATFFNAHTRRRASNLSEEATRILDTLPDLSFMRAKVLMFPIRGAL